MSATTYTKCTEAHIKMNLIIWKVPKFVDLLEDESSRELHIKKSNNLKEELAETKFQLKMRLLEKNTIEIYYLSRTPVYLKSKLTITLHRGQERTVVKQKYRTVQANEWQPLARFFKGDLANYNEWNNFVRTKGTLILKFHFGVKDDIRVPETQLSNDFEKLLTNGLFTDVVMKSAEGVEFKVHKAVLASRCAVLRAHFEHNTKECLTNTLEAPFESDVLREVLTFIYSDKAPSVDDNPERLLAAADYYQLSRLKCLCEGALYKKLTVENAIETLQLADLHSANTLKQLILKFIKDGQAKQLITKTQAWATLKSFELIKIIYEYIVTDEMDGDIKQNKCE